MTRRREVSGGESWREEALCAQTDPELFYPEKGVSNRMAKRVCARCPVACQCLDYAMEHLEQFGIWGGKSERERQAMRRSGRERS